VVLPDDTTDLETAYSEQDYLDVDTKNDVRVGQTATSQYAIHQFKDYVGDATGCILEWEGQTNLAPTLSAVMLQIYDYNQEEWWSVASNTTAATDTDFILTANIADTTDYKDVNGVIVCRVYQLDI
jgi:hypothetical protein